MKKINLKVSPIYGIYKQSLYILLMLAAIALFFVFPQYGAVFLLVAALISLRVIYGIIYYRLILIEIFEDRLSVKKGVFSRSKDFMELYRIKDYAESQPFLMRVFGLMNVTLETSDKSDPVLYFKGVPQSNIVEVIRGMVEIQRKKKGVREFD